MEQWYATGISYYQQYSALLHSMPQTTESVPRFHHDMHCMVSSP